MITPENPRGLSEQDVAQRRKQGLVNTTPKKNTKTTGEILRDNILTAFNGFNLAIGICLALVHAYTNMLYLLIVGLNIVIGIVQEIKAKRMVEHLSLIGAAKAEVVRASAAREIPIDDLVLDDLTLLTMGTHICADSVIESGEIEVNESLLTGEADLVHKRPGDELLSGSFVVSGKCYAKVVHVGAQNYVAKLAAEAQKHKGGKSELLAAMRKVTRFTSFFIIPIGILLFLVAYFAHGAPISGAVVSSAAALLGMLPKGLVLLISTSLVIGIIKLSKQRVLVQDLYALEDLAHVDVLCLDKTGTITEGAMQVSQVYPVANSPLPFSVEQAMGLFVGAMEDNNATFVALKERFAAATSRAAVARTPFSSERKWSSASFEGLGTLVLGAPEKMAYRDQTTLPAEALAAQEMGKRLLCLGLAKEVAPSAEGEPVVELAAVIELSDPIRKNAQETLAFFKQEGVDIKVISGDNPVTVSSIAKQAGLADYQSYVDLSAVHSDKEVAEAALRYSIFGRVSPNQKRLLVQALQAQGHKVAMTGDGVNDVLALKEADCSIAMASGSDATRQVSKLVLVDSDFTALPDLVMEGRRVVNNITRFGGVFFVKTIFSILVALLCIVTLKVFPFTPLQITLYDLMIEAYPAFILALEPDKRRIQKAFLPTVIRFALPSALVVLVEVAALTWLAPVLGITSAQSVTVMFSLIGFAGFLGVFAACRPFNKLRVAIFATAVLGFFAVIGLFASKLKLAPFTGRSLVIIACAAVVCVPLRLLFVAGVRKQQQWSQKRAGLQRG